MRLVLATSNPHKRDEIVAILGNLGFRRWDVRFLREYPNISPIPEASDSFRENARLKAQVVADAADEWALADDSGLVVDALDGAPGIHSARYAGDRATDADRVRKLLNAMRDVSQRQARFVCVMALAHRDREPILAEGICEGSIAHDPRGSGGFGYDPVFYLPEYGKTMAEVGETVKNRISHRARALQALRDSLAELDRTDYDTRVSGRSAAR